MSEWVLWVFWGCWDVCHQIYIDIFLYYSPVILFFCFVSSQQQIHQQRHQARKIQQQAKVKRIYAMCPPSFTKIGSECYYLSSTQASWLDSHFECKDKNAKLAELLKYSDRQIRKYLAHRGRTRGEIWIGGMFDWSKNHWSWGRKIDLLFLKAELIYYHPTHKHRL